MIHLSDHAKVRLAERFPRVDPATVTSGVKAAILAGTAPEAVSCSGEAIYAVAAPGGPAYPVVAPYGLVKTVLSPGMKVQTGAGPYVLPGGETPEPKPEPAPLPHGMAPKFHHDLIQGSDEWLAARCGIVTASEMKLLVTPGGKPAWNDKTRAHLYELAAQRLTGHVEPQYVSDDMLRGQEDEMWARMAYVEHIAPVEEVGFITNNRWGFTIGYSPDGLVGKDGLVEIKSRRQKLQLQTILDAVPTGLPPAEFMLQCQTGLLVSERSWIDFVSYTNGMSMVVLRVWPDDEIHATIIEACAMAEAKMAEMRARYDAVIASDKTLIPIPRRETIGDIIS